jgi:branched-chain amino acid transport system permease protein
VILLLNLLNGISFGSILFLLASGLSLILGVMGILNLAHGALYMVGAYVGWSLAVQCGLNFGLAVLAGGATAGLVALAIHQGLLRHLHGQLDQQVLLTIGLIYILTNLCLWIWGPMPRAPFTAAFLAGSLEIGDWYYPVARLVIILIGLALAGGLWWLQDKTRVGAIVRAGMDDRATTMALGINLELVSTIIFLLGGFLAGFAGVVGAQLLGVYSTLSWDVLLLAIVVVVVGGMGSVQGALIGAMLIGLIDAFGKALFPDFGMFTFYLAMIIILLIRPSGLLGRKV